MGKVYSLMSTGLPELDNVIQNVMPGDNIVWQMDSIEDYILFVHPFLSDAYKKGNKLIYFRFAEHSSLLPEGVNAEVYTLHPEDGFESFIAEIFNVIEKYGTGVFYVFDCLSELTVDWYSDRMLANFFMLTCPYLYDYETVTYFALLRNHHTSQTINAIHNTAQVIIDVYRNKNDLFLQPLKVYKRHTPTMYMLHHWKDRELKPETSSTIISEILEEVSHPWLDFSVSRRDMWIRVFSKAREIHETISSSKSPQEGLDEDIVKSKKFDKEYEKYFQRLLRMAVTRDERVIKLAEKYFELSDLIDIGKHMIGTGLIGGKTVGMLLARAILKRSNKKYWQEKLEPHDSFYIGSDVFYTYLVQSGCWWPRWKQRHEDNVLEGAEDVRQRMLSGDFSSDIKDQFVEILNYFGQSPIIVRSSSLLEDAYGNSFSGKYESVFCANQGTPQERLEGFMNAVRAVYASTMNRDALLYRAQRGLLDRDEQMALLVQRVSGSVYNDTFFPQIAGVGFSYNPFAWSQDIDPKAGVLRLVFGLGTRAVNRSDDDYTCIAALNEPKKRPSANIDDDRKYAQKKIDILDLKANQLVSRHFEDLAKNISKLQLDLFAIRDNEMEKRAKERNIHDIFSWIITFDGLFSNTEFAQDMRRILRTIEDAYEYPVDIEFTSNFLSNGQYKINLLQCRPFQVKRGTYIVREPGRIQEKNLILRTKGPIIGNSVQIVIDRLIYILPSIYGHMSMPDRYSIARLIGKLTNLENKQEKKNIMLIGPGRWGTTTPSLGVPVEFGEINNVSVLCEITEMHEGLVPDVSLGTHFFNDIVELDMLYMAIHPAGSDNFINKKFLETAHNQLEKLLPGESKWSNAVRIIDLSQEQQSSCIYLNVNSPEQKGVCYIGKKE
ncbi:PEP/pyruvate-binding domain-containing protein [Elusimicrobiota bacterium]